MGPVGWIVVVVLAVAGGVLWLMLRYPGGWRYAFTAEYADNRRDLDAARGRLRALERDAGRERDRARAGIAAAEQAHQDRVDRARAHLDRLRSPDRGDLRSSLGEGLRLYDQALEVTAQGRTAEYPLHEVSLRDEYSREEGHVYVSLPTGRQQMVTVALEETAEAEVRKFVVEVFNAVADAKAAAVERQALVPGAEAELREAQADTAAQEEARRQLAELVARQKSDARIPQARRELDAERDRWQRLTGSRPR
ncbi:hypothetical protein ACFWP2_29535 [Kitasatospora sp. NPDC058444]|uniref:hypothetical protein n=1 Tax=Kitasatospora sp. NPDC058444 TaxID=3346504 RepID=UPI003655F261